MQEEIHRFYKIFLSVEKSFFNTNLAGFLFVLDCFRSHLQTEKL